MAIHKNELTDDQVRVLHGRYLAGEKPSDLAIESCLVNRHELMAKFQKLGLPSKNGGAFCRGTVRKETKTAAVPPTAVAPIAEVAETAVSPVTGNVSSDLPAPSTTSPSTTSHSTNGTLELPAIHDQLAAVQQLMEMAQAQSVQVSGTIRLDLVAEIQLQSGKEVPTPRETK